MSESTHRLPVHLNVGTGTQAYLSKSPIGRALVFVHGFCGSAVETWLHFPARLIDQTRYRGYDFYFFGYDGRNTRSRVSAELLREFLSQLAHDPAGLFSGMQSESSGHEDSIEYERVTLIAHSLGALVCRQAIVIGYRPSPRDTWVEKCDLLLYAPAHLGSDISEMVKCSPLGFIYPLLPLAQLLGKWKVLKDLERASQTVQMLQLDTEELIRKQNVKGLISSLIAHAEQDAVVAPDDFVRDPPLCIIRGADHVSVCKPTLCFDAPFERFELALDKNGI